MLLVNELRLGNYILHKVNNKIITARCTIEHFNILLHGDSKLIYPIVLKAELLEICGFVDNKEYALYPDAREYKLLLGVNGGDKNEIYGYIKNNGECFGRAIVNGAIASNNFFRLHQLQNLFYSLTGEELSLKL